jgi:hypothetical protein
MSKKNQSRELVGTYNIDTMELTNKLVSVHQEGNFLVGLTEKGVRFRQRIPNDKILNKRNGEYVLDTVDVA